MLFDNEQRLQSNVKFQLPSLKTAVRFMQMALVAFEAMEVLANEDICQFVNLLFFIIIFCLIFFSRVNPIPSTCATFAIINSDERQSCC